MKKLLSVVFALCLVLTISVFAVSAEATNVAKVGDVEFANLQAAIDAAAVSGESVKLIADVVLDTAVSDNKPSKSAHSLAVWSGQTVELDLAGHTITGTAGNAGGKNYFVIKVFSGSLTINDTVGGGAIICDTAKPGSVRTTVISNYSGTVVLNGGTIENKVSGVSGAFGIESATTHGDASLTINEGAKVYTPYSQAINVTANDKNFVSNFEMNGGEVSGKWAIQLFYSYGDAGCKNNWAINGGTISGTSEALCVASSSIKTDWKDTTLTITGGTFEGEVYAADYTGDNAEAYMTTVKPITGGTFSTDVSAYIAEDYVQGEDGTVYLPMYDVICESNTCGSITASALSVLEGEIVDVFVNPAYGYKFVKLVVTAANGEPVEVSGTSFVMPASNVTVSAIYDEAYPIPEKINFKASVKADDLKAREYKFELSYIVDGKTEVIEVAKNDANGNINFATIIFNGAGNYTFYIKQIAGDNASVEYDATVYAINVKVVYTLDGELVATVTGDAADFTNVAK